MWEKTTAIGTAAVMKHFSSHRAGFFFFITDLQRDKYHVDNSLPLRTLIKGRSEGWWLLQVNQTVRCREQQVEMKSFSSRSVLLLHCLLETNVESVWSHYFPVTLGILNNIWLLFWVFFFLEEKYIRRAPYEDSQISSTSFHFAVVKFTWVHVILIWYVIHVISWCMLYYLMGHFPIVHITYQVILVWFNADQNRILTHKRTTHIGRGYFVGHINMNVQRDVSLLTSSRDKIQIFVSASGRGELIG